MHTGPVPEDLVGEKIAHFSVLEKLGEGGMGVVYKARDEKLGRIVALKLVPEAVATDAAKRARLLREARSAAAVTHANIAAIYEVGEDGGRVYLAMEYIEGDTLRRKLRGGALPMTEALRIARSVARALARAHDRGIVHRDLKPENIVLDEDGEVKVLDFGLAKLREEHPAVDRGTLETADTAEQVTLEGHILGTPGYMSPEQAKGKDVDHRADIFALGAVLYEMLTGTQPFRGETTFDVLVAVSRDEPERASTLNHEVTPALERILQGCLAKSPDDRYANARSLVSALDGLLGASISISASSIPNPPRRRAPFIWGAAAAIALAGGVAAVLLTRDHDEGRRRRPAAPSGASASVKVSADIPTPDKPGGNSAALDAYRRGLQLLRDGSVASALGAFREAVRIDPNLAEAHLMLLAFSEASVDSRKRLATLTPLRASLGKRDAAIFEALRGKYTREPRDVEAEWRDFAKLEARAPRDPFVLVLAAEAAGYAGHPDAAMSLVDKAVAADPKFAWAYVVKGLLYEERGDADAVLATAEKCLTVSPSAATCIRRRANLEEARGECNKLEAEAHAMLALEPGSVPAYAWLGTALISTHAPPESVTEAYRRLADAYPDGELKTDFALHALTLPAMLRGDLAEVGLQRGEREKLRQASSDAEFVQESVNAEIALLEEAGDEAGEVAVAADYVRRKRALAGDVPGLEAVALSVLRRAGRVSEDEVRAAHDAWRATPLDGRVDAIGRYNAWVERFASPARTEREAREALEAADGLASAPPWTSSSLEDDLAVGRVYLLAGRKDDALRKLRDGATRCFPPHLLLDHLRASALLGDVLAVTGNKGGACEAYGEVLTRWPAPKPRSITVDVARAGMKRLGCAK